MGGHIPPSLPPAPEDPGRSAFASKWWPRRRTWIVLGRTLGGFGAFIAALIAAAQFAFGDEEGGNGSTQGETVASPYVFTSRGDMTGTIRFEAPTDWGNVDGSAWTASGMGRVADGTPLGSKLLVAPNVNAWRENGELDTPGVFVGVSALVGGLWAPRDLAETFNYEGCESDTSGPYRRGSLDGWRATATCPETETSWVTLAATSAEAPGALVFVQAKLVGERDQAALDRVLATLELG